MFDLQPLYGLLQAKLQLITHAYFEEKDFSQISILKVRWSETWICSLFLLLSASLTSCFLPAGAVRPHERLSEGFGSGGIAGLSQYVKSHWTEKPKTSGFIHQGEADWTHRFTIYSQFMKENKINVC